MNIRICKLTPEMLDDYLYFFENVAHTDNKEWDRCYCLNYCSDANANIDFSSPDVRREYAIKYIKSGKIQGYLAYCGNEVVGWCNANRKSDCLHCGGWQFISKNDKDLDSNLNIKSVFCFTVAPDMRRKGIAAQLLRRVCEDAIRDGFDYIEAYPNKGESDIYDDYVGPLDLYKKFGFVIYNETDGRFVMQKRLKWIIHITRRKLWNEAKRKGIYVSESLDSDGFIHCSDINQVTKVANSLFKGQRDLVLLYINEDKVDAEIKYEDLYNAGEDYPHIYGPINIDAIEDIKDLILNQEDNFELPK